MIFTIEVTIAANDPEMLPTYSNDIAEWLDGKTRKLARTGAEYIAHVSAVRVVDEARLVAEGRD
jgi:hypothetical protein